MWQVIFLAALGAPRTEAIDRACAHVLDHSRLPDGRFSAHKTAQGAIACLNGNLLRAMLQLGCEDPRLEESLEALAEHGGPRWLPLPVQRCHVPARQRMRDGLPCAWGAIKALGAFAEVPEEQRSPAVREAVEAGDRRSCWTVTWPAATIQRPPSPAPSGSSFGFPLGYTSDLLEALEVLGRVGVTAHPRLARRNRTCA